MGPLQYPNKIKIIKQSMGQCLDIQIGDSSLMFSMMVSPGQCAAFWARSKGSSAKAASEILP